MKVYNFKTPISVGNLRPYYNLCAKPLSLSDVLVVCLHNNSGKRCFAAVNHLRSTAHKHISLGPGVFDLLVIAPFTICVFEGSI